MTKRAPLKSGKRVVAVARAKAAKAVPKPAEQAIRGRAMVMSGEMLAPDTVGGGISQEWGYGSAPKPMSLAEVKKHRILCVQDPWVPGIHWVVDRAAKVEHDCRVVLEMPNYDDSVCYLPGRLKTKHPDKAKALEVTIMGATGEARGPCRGCKHGDVIRVVGQCESI